MSTDVTTATEPTLFHGVCAEARASLIAGLAEAGEARLTAALVASPRRAEELAAELRTLATWRPGKAFEILHLPETPPPDIDTNRRLDRICDRLAVLGALLEKAAATRTILVATPEAIFGGCPSRHEFETQRVELRSGETIGFSELLRKLAEDLDYDSEALCEFPGQFATRGGLIDVYPYDADRPYRIDFFGDEIESIRSFDPSTQLTDAPVERIRLTSRYDNEEGAGGEGQLIDYLPDDAVHWVLEDPAVLVREHPFRFERRPGGMKERRTFHDLSRERAEFADVTHGITELDTSPSLFEEALREELPTEATANYRLHPDAVQVGFDRFESEASARSKFEEQIADWSREGGLEIAICTADAENADRIRELLAENPLTAGVEPVFSTGIVAGGFVARAGSGLFHPPGVDPESGFVLITDTEFFGRQRRKLETKRERARPNLSQVDQLLDFTELADGDPLVHLQHGVCLFRGLTQLEINGGLKEVISVEFADGMTIHVPLHESHLLTRYVGLTKLTPKLGKIGGTTWEKTRREAEVAALDYAAELLSLHARREQGTGYAFPPDHEWQQAFEASFPFEETPDQKTAITTTKADMEKDVPMDRLICGDVGFGKTEVAIRAALKAVLSGKQVAVLVPTTVLCQQHLNTFRERMAQYPIVIEMVSRFRSAAQNREILANLAAGQIDIIIGTHRLLSRDVHFNDLGLLVVDEEQRFGVKQKEAIKKLRADVDILTLSATPIPRTLYLAMAGARAMSVIETPPVDRRPIETIVKSYDSALVKSAIQAEVDRGGQVFYLHNRVATIEGVANGIREMHPRLKVAVGHGQMEERQLERIMTQFVAGDFDVLVCTTIIESGIDIPNCNTLIIEGADRFGLAQLYQIRGRVGRFKRQAYAYLLLHKHAALVNQAHKRLNALKQHNQLGAGFRIAMRDLELRGAGNLLGAEQSGHIAGVGFELYCQLLKESVSRLKGEPGSDRLRAEVKLDFIASGEGGGAARKTAGTVSFAAIKEAEYSDRRAELIEAALPDDFVAEPRLRIDLYRRLAMAPDREVVESIAAEIADRFGALPPSAKALVSLHIIRVLAEAAGVQRVESEGDRLICRLAGPRAGKEFLKSGSRFPRLTEVDPLLRLREIQRFLARSAKAAKR